MKVTLRKKQLKDGRFSFYLDIYHLGKRKYEYLNIYLEKRDKQKKEKIALVEKIRAKRELELAYSQYGFIPDFKKRVSLINYFEKLLESKTKNSIYHNTFRHLNNFIKGDITFQEIDEKWFNNFEKYLLKQVSQNTASSYFSILKHVFKLAKRDKLIIQNVAEDVKNIKQKDIHRDYLTLSELQILAKEDCKVPEIKRAFLFSCFTGLRFSDVKKMKWLEVKPESIEIRQQKTQDIVHLPLSSTAKKLIFNEPNIYHLPDKTIFDLPNRHWTNEVLKDWFKRAGIQKNAHFHVSRHTFATLNITQGAQLYTVSKLLGHKNLNATQIYAKTIDEVKQQAVNNFPEIEVSL